MKRVFTAFVLTILVVSAVGPAEIALADSSADNNRACNSGGVGCDGK